MELDEAEAELEAEVDARMPSNDAETNLICIQINEKRCLMTESNPIVHKQVELDEAEAELEAEVDAQEAAAAAAAAVQKEEGITTVWAAGEATQAAPDSDSDDDSVRQVRVTFV